MEIGNFNQKASPILVWFVFSCIIIIISLLYIKQKSEAVANYIDTGSVVQEY